MLVRNCSVLPSVASHLSWLSYVWYRHLFIFFPPYWFYYLRTVIHFWSQPVIVYWYFQDFDSCLNSCSFWIFTCYLCISYRCLSSCNEQTINWKVSIDIRHVQFEIGMVKAAGFDLVDATRCRFVTSVKPSESFYRLINNRAVSRGNEIPFTIVSRCEKARKDETKKENQNRTTITIFVFVTWPP